jgi:multiple sugar transport system permease protein
MSDAVLQIAGIVPPQEVPAPQGLRPAAHRSDRARIAAAYALSAPALLLMLVLVIAPLFTVVVLAFTDYQLGERTLRFVGLANFRTLASAAVFWKALGNTAVYVLVVVPGSVALGLAAAMLIEGGTRLKAFYRTVMFLPIMATLIAMAIVWEFMLHPTFGLVNLALEAVGLRGRNWLQDGDTALYVLAVIGIWQQFGFNMVLFLAGLLSIPRHLYEAAAIDGARSGWDRFCLVTWPMLGPITLFVAVISTIRAFQIFDTVQALTRGGPNKATEVLLYSMYAEAFEFFRTGYAAAIAVVFIVLVTMLTLIKTNLLERRVHY